MLKSLGAVGLLVTILTSSVPAEARKAHKKPGMRSTPRRQLALPPDLQRMMPQTSLSLAAADTTHLAWFGFDTINGLPDTQGWTTIDRTAQDDEYFHVADSTELDGGKFGGLIPIEGNQSVWCGTTGTGPYCGWGSPPGTGHNWDQSFVTAALLCDSVHISYKVRWDSEASYDWTHLLYWDDAGNTWASLPVDGGKGYYDGNGELVESFGFNTTNGTTQIRFRFTSDGGWDDQDGLSPRDGAILLDSITVECYVADTLQFAYFDDFESAAPGDKSSTIWSAYVEPGYGDFASLYPGATILQEDPCNFDYSHIWGFFADPSVANYACHLPDPRPDVGTVPYGNGEGLYLRNEIWSPPIEITGKGDQFLLRFDVYRDLPLDPLVFYWFSVRGWTNGCPDPRWRNFNFTYFGGNRDWFDEEFDITSLMTAGATHVQIALGAWDTCGFRCFVHGTGQCHSQAPLFDNVHLLRVDRTGPFFDVQHQHLFQDNFAEDGTLTGHARADMAQDIASVYSLTILPGDSAVITVTDHLAGLATDPTTGTGAAVYLYAAVWPPNQPGKSGADLQAPETDAGGTRFPVVDSLFYDGNWWYCIRADSIPTLPWLTQKFCFDFNDSVFTPGDTICYFFCAENNAGDRKYWSRGIKGADATGWWWSLKGQGEGFVTSDISEALDSPCEFTILPASGWRNGGDILYVDDTDDRGGPVQLYFDWFFNMFQITDLIDRYDILAPSSAAGNSLASRVKNQITQIRDCYRKIIWSSGSLSSGLIGDGSGSPEKSDDYGLLHFFLNTHPDNPGLYLTGDDIAEEWVTLGGLGAVNLRAQFLSFDLDNGNHVSAGEPLTPLLTGVSPAFIHAGVPDELIAFAGCPPVNDFDLLIPTGTAVPHFNNSVSGKTYIIGQSTPNAAGSVARVVLSGLSYHHIHDVAPGYPIARWEHLRDILILLQNVIPFATGVPDDPQALANRLDANYPNPFNPVTTIRYTIAKPSHVTLRIYNIAGQLVRTVVDEVQTPRPEGFVVEWDGTTDKGSKVASGVYLYRLQAGDFDETRKMVLLK
jgi:hypothetical protein